jgi:hypothetical protein
VYDLSVAIKIAEKLNADNNQQLKDILSLMKEKIK